MAGLRPPSLIAVVVIAVIAASLFRYVRDFPAADEYSRADEAVYMLHASAVRDGGLRAFARLGREYVADAQAQSYPAPVRVGYLTVAAIALRFDNSMRALSMISAISLALLALAVFIFGRRVWGDLAAALASVFMLVSPIAGGLARRALIDEYTALFVGLSLLAFVSWVHNGRNRDFIWFIAAAFWSMLVKETAFFFQPFFLVAAIVLRWRHVDTITNRHLTMIALVPVAAGVVLVVLFGGLSSMLEIVGAMRAQAFVPGSYVTTYGAGPWSQYLVEGVLLSPLTLLFLGFCGYWLLSERAARSSGLVIAFFWYATACLALFPKNARFALPLDLPTRLGAALMIAEMIARHPDSTSRRWRWRAGAAVGVTTLLVVDLATYHRLFITHKMYDPIAYNLLVIEKVVPPAQLTPTASGQTATAASLLEQSEQSYRARDFAACIRFAEAAVALRPDYAEAYNNIGAANNELKQWDEAIAALQRALQLRPDFALARNNLAWAMSSRK